MIKTNQNPETLQVVPFQFETHELRTIIIDEVPYFVAKDVCMVLGLQNPSMSIQQLDEDERAKKNLGRQGDTWLITESGLYFLITRSNKPEAKRFTKWITKQVLPSIRKTGKYETPKYQAAQVDTKGQISLFDLPDTDLIRIQKLTVDVALKAKNGSKEAQLVRMIKPYLFNSLKVQ